MSVSTPICNFGEKSHDFSLQSTEGKLISLNEIIETGCKILNTNCQIFEKDAISF